SKQMLALTEQSGRESRAMRTLTLAATGHLPANLVMASLCNEPTVSFAWQRYALIATLNHLASSPQF
ncbi:hypothetical protein MCOR16_000737, partial [Pyricularia oryzae]